MLLDRLHLSRRRLLAGGLVLTGIGLVPARSAAQIAPDGFRVIRAQLDGYDGAAPGPALTVKRGEELNIRLVNDLPEPTAIHWHGVRVANAMDGATGVPVQPGQSFDYRFVPRDAGTFWYHASTVGQQRSGLYGSLVVTDTAPADVDYDHLLMLDDGALSRNVPLDISVRKNGRVRLRAINATLDKLVSLRVADHIPWVMAIDGQPAAPFIARDGRIGIGPGNRADLFFDAALGPDVLSLITARTGGTEAIVARLKYMPGEDLRPAPRPDPQPLATNGLPERMDFASAQRATIAIADNMTAAIQNLSFKRGRTVILALENNADTACVVHLHGHSFRLLDKLDDGWKPFWLDTYVIGAKETARISFVADNPGQWLIDCRRLEKPEDGMSVRFDAT